MDHCPVCGETITDRECPMCGYVLKGMKCPECGTPLGAAGSIDLHTIGWHCSPCKIKVVKEI